MILCISMHMLFLTTSMVTCSALLLSSQSQSMSHRNEALLLSMMDLYHECAHVTVLPNPDYRYWLMERDFKKIYRDSIRVIPWKSGVYELDIIPEVGFGDVYYYSPICSQTRHTTPCMIRRALLLDKNMSMVLDGRSGKHMIIDKKRLFYTIPIEDDFVEMSLAHFPVMSQASMARDKPRLHFATTGLRWDLEFNAYIDRHTVNYNRWVGRIQVIAKIFNTDSIEYRTNEIQFHMDGLDRTLHSVQRGIGGDGNLIDALRLSVSTWLRLGANSLNIVKLNTFDIIMDVIDYAICDIDSVRCIGNFQLLGKIENTIFTPGALINVYDNTSFLSQFQFPLQEDSSDLNEPTINIGPDYTLMFYCSQRILSTTIMFEERKVTCEIIKHSDVMHSVKLVFSLNDQDYTVIRSSVHINVNRTHLSVEKEVTEQETWEINLRRTLLKQSMFTD